MMTDEIPINPAGTVTRPPPGRLPASRPPSPPALSRKGHNERSVGRSVAFSLFSKQQKVFVNKNRFQKEIQDKASLPPMPAQSFIHHRVAYPLTRNT